METKPIVTSHGNQEVFSSLHKALLDSLPKEPSEWRRSYGRQARNVFLEASFVPYDDDILPDETDKTLISRPYFHIFWADCDLETYKLKIREELGDWHAALKNKNIPDWLIVAVNSDETKVKTKLLPRSSVYDKIKSDFSSKTPDRIVSLTDPLKQDPKNIESWSLFVSKLRQHLLQAFTRHLQKYEDNMRALREKRNEVGWNFQQYFIVQEELAFMFEMLGLLEDAMIQYDELDALFTQFVVNHASGRVQQIINQFRTYKKLDAEVDPLVKQQLKLHNNIDLVEVPWLKSLIQPCKSWAGLSLHKPIAWDKRNLIKDNEATLLDFRGYLFSRQCALLFLLKRPGEIIKRAIDYLHETVQEMKTLDISITTGGMDCWVFLSGLEVLQRCEKIRDISQPRAQALNTAYLWDYVCRKLHHVGGLCGLMPGSNPQPSSEQLTMVLDLISGMGPEISYDDEEMDTAVISPRDKLRDALSSKESFQKIYMEQSELAMGTFKHIGRFRSARMIGKNLAEFYMKLGDPQKAENFLTDVMTSYHVEGWKLLRDMTRLELATCQYQTTNHQKYIKTACQVASSCLLPNRDRIHHMNTVLEMAESLQESPPILLKAAHLFKIESIDVSVQNITIDQSFQITMMICNNALCDIPCDSITMTFMGCVANDFTSLDVVDQRLEHVKTPLSRQTSNSSLDNKRVMNLSSTTTNDPVKINLQIHHEGNEASGITCVNSHEVLKRNDSSGGIILPSEEPITKDTMSQCVWLTGIILKPGINTVVLNCESLTAGHYKPGQTWLKVGRLEFIKQLQSDLRVTVNSHESYIEISPDKLTCGVNHDVTVTLYAGSTPILPGSKVKVMPSNDLEVTTDSQDDVIVLDGVERGESVKWNMKLFQQPKVCEGKDISVKVAYDCSWLPRPLLTTLDFQNAFNISHKLLTARDMKYIQIQVHGLCRKEFELKSWKLEASNTHDVELVLLNKTNQKLKVNEEQTASLVWQVKCNTAEITQLDLAFSLSYSSLPTVPDSLSSDVDYSFTLNDFLTMFTVKTDVLPNNDEKTCKVGNLATLKIQVFQMANIKPLPEQEYMYEVQGQKKWSCHGKSTGAFSITKGGFTTTLEVLPLIAGFIHLPSVKIFKYNGVITEKDIWTKKAIFEKEEENMDSTDDESSETESDQVMPPSHVEFEQGQVYYSSAAKQVRVHPEQSPCDVEISVVDS